MLINIRRVQSLRQFILSVLLARVLFAIVCAVILYAIFTSNPPQASQLVGVDKLFHFLGLGALSVTAVLAFPATPKRLVWSLLVAAAVSLEILQGVLVPVREFSGLDMLANVIGVVGALLGFRVLQLLDIELKSTT